MDCIPPSSCAHGVLQARRLEEVAKPSSRGSSWPRDRTHVSCSSCIASKFYDWVTGEALLEGNRNPITSLMFCLESSLVKYPFLSLARFIFYNALEYQHSSAKVFSVLWSKITSSPCPMVVYQLHLSLHQNSLYLPCVCQYSVHNNLCIF